MAGEAWDIHAAPAYGRDYKSAKAVRQDWDAGKDFRCVRTGRYLSKRDAEGIPLAVWVRYDGLRKIIKVH